MHLPPRLPPIFSWIVLTLVMGGLAAVLITHSGYVAKSPLILAWLTLCPAAAILLFFTNRAHLSLRAALAFAGFGFVATIVAFVLQAAVNGWLLRELHGQSLLNDMILGLGSGSLQTLGKCGAVAAAILCITRRDASLLLTAGFGVGFGFGITEALLIAVQLVVAGEPLTGLLGVVERSAAIWFHLCSSGLIAIGFLTRDIRPILLVVALHTMMDGLSAYLATRIPPFTLQGIFWIIAAATWLVWLSFRSRALLLTHLDSLDPRIQNQD